MKKSLFIVLILFCVLFITTSSSKSTPEIAKAADGSSKNINQKNNSNFLIKNGKIIKYIGPVNVNRTLVVPEGVTSIGQNAFYIKDWDVKRSERLSICIPKDIKLDKYAFGDAVPMNVTFEEGRTEIEPYSFASCAYFNEGKISVILPSSVKTIAEYSFYSEFCDTMDLKLNEGLETVCAYALAGTKCKLPSTVKVLEEGSLSNIWYDYYSDDPILSGSIVVLPESLEVIGANCVHIEVPGGYIKIPASVKEIGESTFTFGDNAYKSGFIVDKNNKHFKSVNGWLYSKDMKRLIYAYASIGNVVIPEGVEYLGDRSLNTDLNGEGGKQEIYLPSTLKTIHTGAVYWDVVHFSGDAPTLIGNTEITSWTNSHSISPFMNLHKIYVPEGKKQEYIDALYIKVGYEDRVIEEGTNTEEYEKEVIDNDFVISNGLLLDYIGEGGDIKIPEGVTRIGERVFWDCPDIINIYLPDSVTSIAAEAFSYIYTLESIHLPSGITSIGSYAFSGCRKLKGIDIPSNVTKIGEGAFLGCESLTLMVISDNITMISPMTFQGCSSLKKFTIPDTVTYIGLSAFEGCEKLNNLVIPESVTYIGWCAFISCGFNNIVIPEGIKKIEPYSFFNCLKLKSVTIPTSVTSFGEGIFDGCKNLKTIYGTSPSAAEGFSKAAGYIFISH